MTYFLSALTTTVTPAITTTPTTPQPQVGRPPWTFVKKLPAPPRACESAPPKPPPVAPAPPVCADDSTFCQARILAALSVSVGLDSDCCAAWSEAACAAWTRLACASPVSPAPADCAAACADCCSTWAGATREASCDWLAMSSSASAFAQLASAEIDFATCASVAALLLPASSCAWYSETPRLASSAVALMRKSGLKPDALPKAPSPRTPTSRSTCSPRTSNSLISGSFFSCEAY